MVRINNFPSFIVSKVSLATPRKNLNNTEWYINVNLNKYCQTSKKEIIVSAASSDQPESLGIFLNGTRTDPKECSFDVDAIFKFKRPSTTPEYRYSHKFVLNSMNQHYDSWGYAKFARIEVISPL